MAAQCASLMVLSFFNDATPTAAYEVVAGLRNRSMTINSEMVDITNGSSTGTGGPWRELLNECGVRSMTISASGIFLDGAGDEALRDAVFENELRQTKILVPSFGEFVGSFKVTNYAFNGEYNASVMFDVTLESAGAITFTAV